MPDKQIFSDILKRINPYYDVINLIISSLLLLVSAYYAINGIKLGLVLIATIFGVLGVVLFVLRKKIVIEKKLMVTLLLMLIIVLRSFVLNGFIGSGFLGIGVIFTVAFIFLPPSRSLPFAGVIIICYTSIAYMVNQGLINIDGHMKLMTEYKNEWYAQVVTLIGVVAITYLSISAIKKLAVTSLKEYEESNKQLMNQQALLEENQEELIRLAYYDQLTNVYNQYYLTEVLNNNPFYDGQKDVLVALVEIAQLKALNTYYGSKAVDELLVDVTNTFKSALMKHQVVGRLSSDEWVFILPKYSNEQFDQFFKDSIMGQKDEFNVFSSVDQNPYYTVTTLWQPESEDLSEAFNRCRTSVRYAKVNQIFTTLAYDVYMNDQFDYETKLISSVEKAMEEDLFQVWFQGKYNTKDDNISSYEALARWFTKEGDYISPGEFIPLINSSIYLHTFSKYIFKKSLKTFEVLQEQREELLTISINVSPLFFKRNDFESFLNEALEQTTIKASQITLEITEDIYIEHYASVAAKLNRLQKIGFTISLDDFGTGFSSLNHINTMTIDEIKIDREIVSQITSSDKSLLLVDLVVKMAEKMQCQVVAEGVETKEQVDLLKEHGIHLIQGYYYSKPQPLDFILEDSVLN
jgi:EAL domain-containing protein (putative c-di-GMP-specific phosphodiesterase class I)/GGDEF domain-containing protein